MNWTVDSPDGSLTITLHNEADTGSLTYSVTYRGSTVLARSRLGLETSSGGFVDGLEILEAGPTRTVEERYDLPHGKQRSVSATGNERTVTLGNAAGDTIDVVLRAHNDGVAFRYRSPSPSGATVTVTDELTEFAFAEKGRKWSLPHQLPSLHAPAYENAYVDGVPIGHGAPIPGWLFPSLFQSGETWVLLSESGIDGSYPAGHLDPNPVGLTYRMSFPQPGEALAIGDHRASNDGQWQTPWRVVMVSDGLEGIFESNFVRDLAPPTALVDVSWIEPGRVAWSWWSDHDSPQDPAKLKAFVDFASEMGWEHMLIDANWNLIPAEQFISVLEHASARDVGLFLWYNSGGPNNDVTEQPRDRMYDTEARRAEMEKLVDWGVKGVKVDFFHSDKQTGMQLYLDIISDAADAGLMVNFHGSTIPRGWERTWPNVMTMEGVRGAEQYDFVGTYPEEAPWHNVILAMTRNVVGPMDYTPVTFSDVTYPHITTNAHELALSVVFESPLQHFADSAESYRAQPPEVVEFLRMVPTTWDETRFVAGYPGDFIVVARRSGSTWYLGGINGRSSERTVRINVDELAADVELSFIGDGDDSRTYRFSTLRAGGPIEVTMSPHGGFVATSRLDD